MLQSLSLVDLLLILGLLVSVIVGCWRGLVVEVLALMGWVAAYLAARWWGADLAPMVPVGESGSQMNLMAGMAVMFVLAWIVWALMAWLIAQLVRGSVLSGADRLLGSVFGLARGVFVALLVCAIVTMTPLAQWEPWRASHGVAVLQDVLAGLRPVLPEQVNKFLPEQS